MKELDFLASVVNDYVHLLDKQGHETAAKTITGQANAAIAAIRSSSNTPVPRTQEADDNGPDT